MKEHPLMFRAEMVRAILAGRKTQTRRLDLKKKWAVGDRIWVKETWWPCDCGASYCSGFVYRSDGEPAMEIKWKSAMFMPRQASRIILEITGLREDRLQDIGEEDAEREGVENTRPHEGLWRDYMNPPGVAHWTDAVGSYQSLWESINGPGSWDENPVVRVIEFKVVSK